MEFSTRANSRLDRYILFFDPSTYAIDRFYDPAGHGDPPLKAGGELQIGGSVASMAAITLMIEPGESKVTDFMKVFFGTFCFGCLC
jgi:hypothetical protein